MDKMKSQKQAWLQKKFVLSISVLVYAAVLLIMLGLVAGLGKLVIGIII